MGEPETLEGKVLAGRYRLEHQLGEGGFGTIWRAEQLVLGATVAIKLIDLAIARQAGALERFLREAQAAAALRSPHVVQVLDYGVDGDQPFIAMELLEGETLAQRLHRLGRLAPSEALRIVTQVARAMTRAHESNIVHRDLKPDNVFLVRNEDEEVTKVLDFGVAKIKNPDWMDESTQTRTGSLIGTPHYMSPEQVQGNKAVDYRSDLWSLGVIAFEMFTGQRPFVGNALGDLVLQICVREMPVPSRLAPVPAGFDEWFAKAAERDPERRFQSARDLAAALREVVGGGERDIELVIADEVDTFRAAPTSGSASGIPSTHPSSNRASGAPDAGAATTEAEAPSPIQFAKTMRGDTVAPHGNVEQQVVVESLPTQAHVDGVTSARGLGRIVFAAMAALLITLVSLAAILRSKGAPQARANFAAPSAITSQAAASRASSELGSQVAERRESIASAVAEPVAPSAAAPKHANLEPIAKAKARARTGVAGVARATKSRNTAAMVKPISTTSGSPQATAATPSTADSLTASTTHPGDPAAASAPPVALPVAPAPLTSE